MREFDIVIPTHNRQRLLKKCIDSIVQSINHAKIDTNVFIVEDGQVYHPRFISQLMKYKQIYYYNILKSGPSAARNFGADKTDSKYIMFIDDDCVLPLNYFSMLNHLLMGAAQSYLAFGGGIKPYEVSKYRMIDRYLSKVKHLDGPITSNGIIINLAGANLCIMKSAFIEAGGFNSKLFNSAGGEDQCLITELSLKGPIGFFPELILFHNNKISIFNFLKKFYNYGKGIAINYNKYGGSVPLDDIYFPIIFTHYNLIEILKNIFKNSTKRVINHNITSYPSYFILSLLQEISLQLGFNQHLNKNDFKKK